MGLGRLSKLKGLLGEFSKPPQQESKSDIRLTALQHSLYKGVYPLWGRKIPYTMMKFASFETIVEMMYQRLPGQKSDYSTAAQTGVAFSAGYLAGILCAIVGGWFGLRGVLRQPPLQTLREA